MFDCNSHIPLYVATVKAGSQLVDRRVQRERLIQNAARYPNIFSMDGLNKGARPKDLFGKLGRQKT